MQPISPHCMRTLHVRQSFCFSLLTIILTQAFTTQYFLGAVICTSCR